jgi:D-aminopeptidase
VAFGFKGGIGTASRRLPNNLGGYTVGVLVQTNFGGVLSIGGAPVGQELGRWFLRDQLQPHTDNQAAAEQIVLPPERADGSVIIVIATDAPLDGRNLNRMAARSMLGLARTGAAASNGSGDYAIAFSVASECRIRPAVVAERHKPQAVKLLANDAMSPCSWP